MTTASHTFPHPCYPRNPRFVLLFAGLIFFGVAHAASPEIHWLPDHSAVEVANFGSTKPDAKWSESRGAKLFTVRPADADETMPPMLGNWSLEGGALRFTPRFPFVPGMRYLAVFDPGEGSGKPITSWHEVPKSGGTPSTVVANIFPGGDTAPENLLKFYLHFSAPMSGGGIYRHIHLRDDAGKEVELPFLELGEELWDREMKRLTLFIDPGRIKREVKPLEDIGPALVAGKQFTLVIDAAWQDAAGQPMLRSAEKKFAVAAPDRTPPDPKSWKITPPGAGTSNPLRVNFSEPMEHALALRLIAVKDTPGRTSLNETGLAWSFIPDKTWTAGAHRLVIQPDLEDLAGNSIGKPFEVDIAGTEKDRPPAQAVELGFDVR